MVSTKSVRWAVVFTCLLSLLAAPSPARAWSADGSGIHFSECYEFAGGQMCFVSQPSPDYTAPYYAPPAYQHQYPHQYPQQYPHQYPQQYPAPSYHATHPQSQYGTYMVRWGDTLSKIAYRLGIPLGRLIAANPQIWNPSLIYPGQIIYLPSYYGAPAYHGS